MCTAVTYTTKDNYFGRTFDWFISYGEKVVITPRNYPLRFKVAKGIEKHFAMIGMAVIADDYPLYFDATNEFGLSMAGLNFPENAYYNPVIETMENITPYEIIPWILSQCKNVKEAKEKLANVNIVNFSFNMEYQLSPLHFIVADKNMSITVEPVKEGLKIYDNPVGVLTNNPTFDKQLFNLNNYKALKTKDSDSTFAKGYLFNTYSLGMGALGLPGDFSSMSRFVRASFIKMNSVSDGSEGDNVTQFFHILKSVEMPRGVVRTEEEKYEVTLYTSCCNTDKGIYYYTTHGNSQISSVGIHNEDLEGEKLIPYELIKGQHIRMVN